MKKILCAFLAICLTLSLAIPVFAEEETTITEISVDGLVLPVAGETVSAKPLEKAKIKVFCKTDGENTQPEKVDNYTASGYWSEADSPKTPLQSGTFVAGRKYRINVTLSFDVMDEAPKVHDSETDVSIGDQKVTQISTAGENVIFCADFVATPGEFAPKVTLTTTGGKTKSYDGKATVIKAEVEKIEGISYRYEWYRDGKLVEGETAESFTLKNVSDSGEYYCAVYATAPDAKEQAEKSTKSTTVEISITPCIVTVEIQDAEKNLFDPDPEFTYKVLGDAYDELSGELARKEGEELGKYTIGIGTVAFPEEVAANYELKVIEGTLSIIQTGELPYVPVTNFGDQSYITGKDDSKIRISAPKGALAEGAVLSLVLSEAEAKEALEKEYGAKLMKSFTVKLQDESGKEISLPKHATLRIQIPLSEEEEAFKPETIFCALYNKGIKKLTPQISKNGSVSYVSLEIDSLGTVAIFEGQKSVTEKPSQKAEKPAEEEKGGSLWMWILIVLLSLSAVGAIVFTVIQNKKTAAPTKVYTPSKKPTLTPEQMKEKERARKIAEEMNKLPPVPEKKVQETGMETRPVKTPEAGNGSAEEGKTKTRKVSFEDLE